MSSRNSVRGIRIRPLTGALLVAAASRAPAQSAAPPPALANWSGAIRCEIQSVATGYTHQETQTWTLGAPTQQGSVTVYPAKWSVSGQGWHDRTRGSTRRVAQWTVNTASQSSPAFAAIGFQLQPVGGGFVVARRNAQLTTGGGYTGPDQLIQNGVAQPPTRLVGTVYEWMFSKIEAAPRQTQLTGSTTMPVRTQVGPLQPEDAQSTVSCAWALGQGAAPALPPSALPPPSPVPGSQVATAQPGGPTPPASSPATSPTPPTAAPTSTAPAVAAPAPTAPVTTPAPTAPATSTPGSSVTGGVTVASGGGVVVGTNSPTATGASTSGAATTSAPTPATTSQPAGTPPGGTTISGASGGGVTINSPTATGVARAYTPASAGIKKVGTCSAEVWWSDVSGAKEYIVTQAVEGTYVRTVRSPFCNCVTGASARQERHVRSVRIPAPALVTTLDFSSYGGSNVTHTFDVAVVDASGQSPPTPAGSIAACDGPSWIQATAYGTGTSFKVNVSPTFPW